jgi:outer membrane immunogenic protein
MKTLGTRTLTLGCLAIAALSGPPAMAADMAVKAPSLVPAPVYNWTGFYIGGNAGYGWTGGQSYPLTGTQSVPPTAGAGLLTLQQFGAYPLTSNLGQRGAIGGVQAGFNWQFNSLVTGIETDFDFSGIKGSTSSLTSTTFVGGGLAGAASNISRSLRELGTTRLRVGWAIDRTLLFASGGLAYGRNQLAYAAQAFAAGVMPLTSEGAGSSSTAAWQAGWTLGAGAEFAPWDHWLIRAEYLYYDLGTQSTTIVAPIGNEIWTGTTTVRNNGQIVRAGLSYKF